MSKELNPERLDAKKRDLKFRTWDDKAKGFIHFNILSAAELIAVINNDLHIEQFSGLKDASGTEIYEGDILKTNADSEPAVLWKSLYPEVPFPNYTHGVVEFVNSSFGLTQENLGRTELDKLTTGARSSALEIIGNTHTHPKLAS